MPLAASAKPRSSPQRATADESEARVEAPAAGSTARLNLFQRMMLRWRSLHPYNPVHAVLIPATLDSERLRRSIATRLEQRGLSGLWVAPDGSRFCFTGGPAVVQLETSPALLDETIEREINRPFAASGRPNPFRFIVVDAPQGISPAAGL